MDWSINGTSGTVGWGGCLGHSSRGSVAASWFRDDLSALLFFLLPSLEFLLLDGGEKVRARGSCVKIYRGFSIYVNGVGKNLQTDELAN